MTNSEYPYETADEAIKQSDAIDAADAEYERLQDEVRECKDCTPSKLGSGFFNLCQKHSKALDAIGPVSELP